MYYLPGFEDWSKRALSWIAGTLIAGTIRVGAGFGESHADDL